MQKNKNLAYLFLFTLLLSSCGEYHKVLNKGTSEEQYEMAVKMYETKKFARALLLLKKITPEYKNTPKIERISFMIAQSYFNEEDYKNSAYYFEDFSNKYLKSSKREEAAFLTAYSYKLESKVFSKDPASTNKALESFQSFINRYPNSDKIQEANKHYKELRYKLQKKYFEIAKTYYRVADYDFRNYKAAIQAFDNLLSDFLGSEFKEEALYYKLKVYHDFVLKSTTRRKAVRVDNGILVYEKLKRNFPDSKYIEEANAMLAKMKAEKKEALNIVKKRTEYLNSLKK